MSDPHAHGESFSEKPMHGHGHDHAFSEHPMSDHHGHGGTAAAPFNDAEIAYFHGQDLYAAKVVVCEMVGIFLVGVVLYSIVAWTCM